jgi:DNA invertase Pin-like site-specific DNA recombinase
MSNSLTRGAGARAANGVSVLRARDRRRLESLAARRAKLDDQQRKAVRELRARGATVIELADALGVARQTVYNWLKGDD